MYIFRVSASIYFSPPNLPPAQARLKKLELRIFVNSKSFLQECSVYKPLIIFFRTVAQTRQVKEGYHRLIQNRYVTQLISINAYLYVLVYGDKGTPFVFMSLSLPPAEIDVNCHPSKEAVALLHEQRIVALVKKKFEEALKELRGKEAPLSPGPTPAAASAVGSPSSASKGKRPLEKGGKEEKRTPPKKVRHIMEILRATAWCELRFYCSQPPLLIRRSMPSLSRSSKLYEQLSLIFCFQSLS